MIAGWHWMVTAVLACAFDVMSVLLAVSVLINACIVESLLALLLRRRWLSLVAAWLVPLIVIAGVGVLVARVGAVVP